MDSNNSFCGIVQKNEKSNTDRNYKSSNYSCYSWQLLIAVSIITDGAHFTIRINEIAFTYLKLMTTSIAEYYLNELYDWKSANDLYIEEVEESEEWLELLLKFDTVLAFAAKVEHHLNQLFLSKENLLQLRSGNQSDEKRLYKDQTPVFDEFITDEIKIQHKQLRLEVHRIEKEYLDTKYERDAFLADAIEIQNRIRKINS